MLTGKQQEEVEELVGLVLLVPMRLTPQRLACYYPATADNDVRHQLPRIPVGRQLTRLTESFPLLVHFPSAAVSPAGAAAETLLLAPCVSFLAASFV